MREVQEAEARGEEPATKRRGVERVPADTSVYNIPALWRDIERDRKILKVLDTLTSELVKLENNTKLQKLAEHIKESLAQKNYGKKVLVFSFFADTVTYLEQNLASHMADIPGFAQRAAFVSGQGSASEQAAQKFSPLSKKYALKNGETEIDFLFATDVLSEGQNLQDCGSLVNYDLHWNPVRMIQRNGRVNRLGSKYRKVLIGNMKPEENIEFYLRLVYRLERKIETIKNTIGTDQSVLGEEANPIEFIERYYHDGSLPEPGDAVMALSDEHVLALREFLAINPAGSAEFKRVAAMPEGKWNYLPLQADASDEALALMRVSGKSAQSGAAFSDTFFLSVKPEGEYMANPVDASAALRRIKCGKDDNTRRRDAISLDRKLLARRADSTARTKAQRDENPFKLSLSEERALTALQEVMPESVGLSVIQRGVSNVRLEKELKKLLREVNRDIQESGVIHLTRQTAFVKLYREISANVPEEKIVETSEGVLFYAPA
jgi:superfamily II DNA/RNA helicase